MARAEITVPEELLKRSRDAGLNVSQLASQALAKELDRQAKVAALDLHLNQLDPVLGPVREDELQAARAWADRAFAGGGRPKVPAAPRFMP